MSGNYLQRPSRSFWILLAAAILTVALRWLLTATVIENGFSRGWFQWWRSFWDTVVIRFIPIPLIYVFWALVAWGFYRLIRAFFRRRKHKGWGAAFLLLGYRLLRFFCWLIIAFFWLWGYNYGRLPVEEVMDFRRYSPELEDLRKYVFEEGEALGELRAQFQPDDALPIRRNLFPQYLQTEVRQLLIAALQQEGYPVAGKVRIRELWPPGILLRWGTAGVYWPWASEGNVDGGLTALQLAPIMAHEMAHGYGFGDEGVCNFWSTLAGFQAEDPVLEYAFRLDYWRRMASQLRRAQPTAYVAWRQHSLDPGIVTDLEYIYRNNARFPDLLPRFRYAFYNTYLQVQGVSEGVLSYGTVIQLVEGYKRRGGDI